MARRPDFWKTDDDLWDAEKKFLRCAVAGERCIFAPERPTERTNGNAIRVDLIRWMVLGGDEDYPCHERGIDIEGAHIDGALDLQNTDISCKLGLYRCLIPETLDLLGASLRSLHLDGSRLAAKDCSLRADRLETRGGVFLRNGFEAEGRVRLLGARIGGNFECDNSKFEAKDNALDADRLETRGSVSLRNGFKAAGSVRLLGAKIGRNLECDNSKFEAKDNALYADRLEARGSVYLRDGFEASGNVRLLGARIGGDLDCIGGAFHGAPYALRLDSAVIDRAIILRGAEDFAGIADLTAAQAGTYADDAASWPPPGKLILDGFRYDRIMGPCDAAMRIDWLERQQEDHLTTDFRPQPYEHLAKILRGMGHVEAARDIAIAREERLRKVGKVPSHLWPFHWLYGSMFGYGYRPLRALNWAVVIMMIGWGVFLEGWHRSVIVPNSPVMVQHFDWHDCQTAKNPTKCWIQTPSGEDYPTFAPLVYSMDSFIPLIDLGQENAWAPNWDPKRSWGYGVQLYWWLHAIAGWLIATAIVAFATRDFQRMH